MSQPSSDSQACPIDANGRPLPDPEAAWESKRRAWCTPSTSTSATTSNGEESSASARGRKRKNDPVFALRLQELERMLRVGTSAGAGNNEVVGSAPSGEDGTEMSRVNGLAAGVDGMSGSPLGEEEEPDGGMVIRQRAGDELKRVSEVSSLQTTVELMCADHGTDFLLLRTEHTVGF